MNRNYINRAACIYLVFQLLFPLTFSAQENSTSILDSAVQLIEEDSTQAFIEAEPDEEEIEYFEEKISESINQSIFLRKVPDSVIEAMKRDEDFWYVNEVIRKKENKPLKYRERYYDKQWFKTSLWIFLIVVFTGTLIWFLAASNVNLFRKKKILLSNSNLEEGSENIFEINYGKEIYKAVQGGNYRLAIRLHFLRLLKSLSEKNLIRYQQDLTNFDYMLQLQDTLHYKEFFRLTRHYEYAWYGEMNPNPGSYQIIQNEFDSFINKLDFN